MKKKIDKEIRNSASTLLRAYVALKAGETEAAELLFASMGKSKGLDLIMDGLAHAMNASTPKTNDRLLMKAGSDYYVDVDEFEMDEDDDDDFDEEDFDEEDDFEMDEEGDDFDEDEEDFDEDEEDFGDEDEEEFDEEDEFDGEEEVSIPASVRKFLDV